jgi:hypothetical protein
VDDCLIVSEKPKIILKSLDTEYKYRLKDVGPPTRFLGAKIDRQTIFGTDYWSISAEAYLEKAIALVEKIFGKLDTLFRRSRLDTPAPTDFHPELDDTPFLDADSITLYQSYIGILQWGVELGRIDIAHFLSTMAKFAACGAMFRLP